MYEYRHPRSFDTTTAFCIWDGVIYTEPFGGNKELVTGAQGLDRPVLGAAKICGVSLYSGYFCLMRIATILVAIIIPMVG